MVELVLVMIWEQGMLSIYKLEAWGHSMRAELLINVTTSVSVS